MQFHAKFVCRFDKGWGVGKGKTFLKRIALPHVVINIQIFGMQEARMDKRARFWRDGYNRVARTKSNAPENEVNVYTSHGWEARGKLFAKLLDARFRKGVFEPDMHAADLGCGTARYSRLLSDSGFKVTAMDFSAEIIRYAAGRANKPIAYVNAECSHLPFRDRAFDLIISFGVISVITEPEPFFRELKRISKPKSRIMLMTLNLDYFRNWFDGFHPNRDLPTDVEIIQYSPPKLIKKLKRTFHADTIKFIPIFIFPGFFEFMEPVFQQVPPLKFMGRRFASAFILEIIRG